MAWAETQTPQQTLKTYFDKTFVTEKLTLSEAKAFRTLTNVRLSGLTTKSSLEKHIVAQLHVLLLIEIASRYPKESQFFNVPKSLNQLLIVPYKPANYAAELEFLASITTAKGPLKTIQFIEQHRTQLLSIGKKEQTALPLGHKCDLLSQLFITDDYENCLTELFKILPPDSNFLAPLKLSQLRYYYTSSALLFSRADPILNQILEMESFKKDLNSSRIMLATHEILRLSLDLTKIKETLNLSKSLESYDLSERARAGFNFFRNRAILFYKIQKFDESKQQLKLALDLAKTNAELIASPDIQNSSLLLELLFLNSDKKSFDYTRPNLLSTEPVCTQNLFSHAQLALSLHISDYSGDLFDKIQKSLDDCKKMIGLKNQEPHIKNIFEIAFFASQKQLNSNSLAQIKKNYDLIDSHFYSINYFSIAVEALLKKKPVSTEKTL